MLLTHYRIFMVDIMNIHYEYTALILASSILVVSFADSLAADFPKLC